ncbi:MAG TPA: class I SAM-dependent methyltransferase [Bacteroidales bacterium]|nr:class I SAM-dependent methyltransferase [Bacteroidales bacterium]
MRLYPVTKYIEYFFFSRHSGGHGVHSPFIFDIVSRVFRNKTEREVVLRIEKIRKGLLKDSRIIIVNDLGAGQMKRKSRNISEIARSSAVPEKYGRLLYNLAAEFGGSSIIELGTSLGISAMYMAASAPSAKVYTVEGCSECAEIALENFNEARFDNIVQMKGAFDDVLPEIASSGIRPSMVFIDGDHRKEPLLKNFKNLSDISDEKTVIVVDDIYYSREMTEAWNEIKNFKNVSATIDIYRMGIVFFRNNITRNHYRIRY